MHSNRAYEAGQHKARRDLGIDAHLHPVQPPAPWTQEVDKRLRVSTGSAMEKTEKRAYGLRDIIGDALAAGTAGYAGYHAGRLSSLAEKGHELNQQLLDEDRRSRREGHGLGLDSEDPVRRKIITEFDSARKEYDARAQNAERVGGLVLAGTLVPVGRHWLTTPLATTAGAIAGDELGLRLAPASPGARAAFNAGGALAGRFALRGFDALRERMAKKKEVPPDAEKKSFENVDHLPGGPADKKKPEDFDPTALRKGQKHEMEHTTDPAIAREIASDHLTEHPRYYEVDRRKA